MCYISDITTVCFPQVHIFSKHFAKSSAGSEGWTFSFLRSVSLIKGTFYQSRSTLMKAITLLHRPHTATATSPRCSSTKTVAEPRRTPHLTALAKLRARSRQRWDHLSAAAQSVNSLSFVILSADPGVQPPRRESRRTRREQTRSQPSDKPQ